MRKYTVFFKDGIEIDNIAYDAHDAIIQACIEYSKGQTIQCPPVIKIEPSRDIIKEFSENVSNIMESILNKGGTKEIREGRQYQKKNKK